MVTWKVEDLSVMALDLADLTIRAPYSISSKQKPDDDGLPTYLQFQPPGIGPLYSRVNASLQSPCVLGGADGS